MNWIRNHYKLPPSEHLSLNMFRIFKDRCDRRDAFYAGNRLIQISTVLPVGCNSVMTKIQQTLVNCRQFYSHRRLDAMRRFESASAVLIRVRFLNFPSATVLSRRESNSYSQTPCGKSDCRQVVQTVPDSCTLSPIGFTQLDATKLDTPRPIKIPI